MSQHGVSIEVDQTSIIIIIDVCIVKDVTITYGNWLWHCVVYISELYIYIYICSLFCRVFIYCVVLMCAVVIGIFSLHGCVCCLTKGLLDWIFLSLDLCCLCDYCGEFYISLADLTRNYTLVLVLWFTPLTAFWFFSSSLYLLWFLYFLFV